MALGMMAHAQNSSGSSSDQSAGESTSKIQDLQKKDEQMKDIDDEITNQRLRATLGSKSKWSVRTASAYQGGSVKKPFDAERPNYRGAVATNTATFFTADIAVKRRLGDMDSLNFGTGLTLFKPFHRTLDEATNSGSGSRNATVSNPYLEYNVAYKMGNLQASTALTYVHHANKFDVDDVKSTGMFDISQTIIGEVTNKLSLGAAISISKTFYKGSSDFDGQGNAKVELDPGLYPFAEYMFNDKYSFRTVFGYFQFQEFANDKGKFRQLTPYQSMGIGISMSRDVYIYPNIQFTPKEISSDRTNLGISANINIF
jgi:hypothetical protein